MPAAIELADVFRAAGPAYRAEQAGHLSLDTLKVMAAIERFLDDGRVEIDTDGVEKP